MILDINVTVNHDQYHVTISRAQLGPYRGQLLTADQRLVVDWIAGSSKVRQPHTNT